MLAMTRASGPGLIVDEFKLPVREGVVTVEVGDHGLIDAVVEDIGRIVLVSLQATGADVGELFLSELVFNKAAFLDKVTAIHEVPVVLGRANVSRVVPLQQRDYVEAGRYSSRFYANAVLG